MGIKCSACHFEIEEPLILFNGDWVCPHCKKNILDKMENVKFEITDENEFLFNLSESYYCQALKAESKKLKDSYIVQAIKYCQQAMDKKHPYAYFRMGYYFDKDYLENKWDENRRCQIAYSYYVAVLEGKIDESNKKRLEEIQETTKEFLYTMLYYWPEAHVNDSKYFISNNVKKYDLKEFEKKQQNTIISNLERFKNSLLSLNQDNGTTLCGVFKFDKESFEQFLKDYRKDIEKPLKDRKWYNILKNSAKVIFYYSSSQAAIKKEAELYFNCFAENQNNSNNIRNALVSEQGRGDDLLGCLDAKVIYACFISQKKKHKYFSTSQVSKINKFLIEDDENNRESILGHLETKGNKNWIIIYDDDIYAQEGRNIKNKVYQFVEELLKN